MYRNIRKDSVHSEKILNISIRL